MIELQRCLLSLSVVCAALAVSLAMPVNPLWKDELAKLESGPAELSDSQLVNADRQLKAWGVETNEFLGFVLGCIFISANSKTSSRLEPTLISMASSML